jgi:phosphoribosylanthranilate isomerase
LLGAPRRAHSRVRVKICGVTNWADARLAIDLGADALGFNFYAPSPRSVSPQRAWEMIRKLPPLVMAVGVFVDWPWAVVGALARALHLGAVQLHGAERPEDVRALSGRFAGIKGCAVRPGFRLGTLSSYGAASAFLLDGFRQGLHGGTGKTADWRIARRANHYGRVILAGGIRPDNVAQAIAEARPFAIDVASGVEARPGKKDPGAMRALMHAVTAANCAEEPKESR